MEFEENILFIIVLDVDSGCRHFDGLYKQRQ